MTPAEYIRGKATTARRYAQHRPNDVTAYLATAQALEGCVSADDMSVDLAATTLDYAADDCRDTDNDTARVLDATADELRLGLHL